MKAVRNVVAIVRQLRGFTLEIFAGNLIFGLKHTLYLPDHDSSGWTPSNYFSGASNQGLVTVALGPSSSEAAILFSMSDFSSRLW